MSDVVYLELRIILVLPKHGDDIFRLQFSEGF